MKTCIVLLLLLVCASACRAAESVETDTAAAQTVSEPGIFRRFADRVSQTWHAEGFDLYVPVYTWHNRLTYDKHKIRKYNENPWGAGLGKTFIDEDGDSHMLYAMGFADSHSRFQPIAGYGFIKNWYMDEARDFSLGLGFTLSVTARHEYDYIPLPLPLPLAGIQYKRLAVQAAYIPGTHNNGNVLFTWVRWHFN